MKNFKLIVDTFQCHLFKKDYPFNYSTSVYNKSIKC